MANTLTKALTTALQSLLGPVIRFCMKNSIGLQEFMEAAKVVYIRIAAEELESSGTSVNFSRLSAATGVHRKDAVRIFRDGEIHAEPVSFTSRVIGQWLNDRRFCSAPGKPRILSFESDDSAFYKLVRTIGQDLRPGTVLFDMERTGLVERTKKGLRLLGNAYVPKSVPLEQLKLLGADLEDFMMAILDNIYEGGEKPANIHVVTVYDNIDERDLEKIRAWFNKKVGALHQQSNKMLAGYDLDVSPNKKKVGGKRIVLGTFTRT